VASDLMAQIPEAIRQLKSHTMPAAS
jgi:hypothetical protein